MADVIDNFKGEFDFLSNFYSTYMIFNGKEYRNTEAAFHAQKDPSRADEFQKMTASEAKSLGRKVDLRGDWEDVKVELMAQIVYEKFAGNSYNAKLLLDTGDRELIEGNWWNDRFWGVCKGVGENKLGKILMYVRELIRNDEKPQWTI